MIPGVGKAKTRSRRDRYKLQTDTNRSRRTDVIHNREAAVRACPEWPSVARASNGNLLFSTKILSMLSSIFPLGHLEADKA